MITRIACSSALGGLLFGYDLALIGVAILSLKESLRLSDSQQEAIVGAAKFGAVWGTFVGGACMLCYGRVKAISISSVFFTVGPAVMAVSHGVWGLIAGRVITGLGVGASAVIVPAYLGEMAAAQHRGAVVQVYEVALCLGMFMSTFIDYAFRGLPGDWRWMVGLPAIPGAIMGLSTFFLPESARWLALNGYPLHQQGIGEAQLAEIEHEVSLVQQQRAVSKQVLPGTAPHGLSPRRQSLESARKGAHLYSMVSAGSDGCGHESDTSALLDNMSGHGTSPEPEPTVDRPPRLGYLQSLASMFTDIIHLAKGTEQRPFLIAIALAFFNQANASSSVIMYAPSVLVRYNTPLKNAILFSSLVAVTKLVGVLAGMFTVDCLGRRPLLVLGAFVCGVAHIGATWSLAVESMAATLASFCLFILSFSCSWAGGFWVLLSELFSLDAKSPAASAATAFLFLTGSLVNFMFLSSVDFMGPYAFLLFAFICFAAAAFVWWFLPETKGKTLLEVQALLAAGRRPRFSRPRTSNADPPSL